MLYNKQLAKTLLIEYFKKKYNLEHGTFRVVLQLANDVYFLELTHDGIWYSISNKHPMIIQEHKINGAYLFEASDIALTKEEYFNLAVIENILEVVLYENIMELSTFIYEVLVPSTSINEYD